MFKKRTFFLLLNMMVIFVVYPAAAQLYTWDYAASFSGSSTGAGRVKIAQDLLGNTYVTGEFDGTKSFGSITLTAVGTKDIFVAKYDSSGTCIWAISGGGPGNLTNSGGIIYHNGILYITGSYIGKITLGGKTVSTAPPNQQMFFALISTVNGFVSSLSDGGGAYDDRGVSICKSANGGFYVTGSFAGTATFGGFTVNSGSFANRDMFLAKYNSLGTCMWVKHGGSTTDEEEGRAVKELPNGDVVISGYFQGTAFFGSHFIWTAGGNDIFLVSYDQNGVAKWATSAGGAGNDLSTAVTTDSLNFVYVTGVLGFSSMFQTINVAGDGYGTAFLAKYDQAGSIQWVQTGESFGQDIGTELATDPAGNSYMVGNIENDAVFSGTSITGVNGFDGFISKYNPAGTLQWVLLMSNQGINDIRSVSLQLNGQLVVCGEFSFPMTLGSTTIQPSNSPFPSIFLTRLTPITLSLAEIQKNSPVLYPQPSDGHFSISGISMDEPNYQIEIYSSAGSLVCHQSIAADAGKLQISLADQLIPGFYTLRIIGQSSSHVLPLVVSAP